MTNPTPAYKRFLAELKRRKVFRVMAVYGATAFVVLQVADLLGQGMGLPDDSITNSHFTVSAGPSFLLWMRGQKSLLGPLNVLRFSTGPRFRLSSGSGGSGVDWEFKFSFRQ